ncbi:MAG: hypothetical protein K2Y37_03465 [Pirellulales bacterium]|nr:hypothetical protein [Pirellulales bacterium]
MRYKVKSSNDDRYANILAFLRDHDIDIALQNDHRRLLAVEDLSDEERSQLIDLGATIAPDVQYAPE